MSHPTIKKAINALQRDNYVIVYELIDGTFVVNPKIYKNDTTARVAMGTKGFDTLQRAGHVVSMSGKVVHTWERDASEHMSVLVDCADRYRYELDAGIDWLDANETDLAAMNKQIAEYKRR